jgi:hypothetical protein
MTSGEQASARVVQHVGRDVMTGTAERSARSVSAAGPD